MNAAIKQWSYLIRPFLALLLCVLVLHCLSLVLAGQVSLHFELKFLLPVIVCALLFNLSKATSLYFAVSVSSGRGDFFELCLLVVRAAFIEVTTFPAKLIGDSYRFHCLPGCRRQRLSALFIFRVSSVVPIVVLWLVVMENRLLALVITVCSAWALFGLKRWLLPQVPLVSLVPILCGHMMALLCWVTQGYLLLHCLSDSAPDFVSFASVFAIAQMLSSLTSIPFGLGVKEAVYGLSLSAFLGPEQMIVYLACLRLSGELFSAFLGWLCCLQDDLSGLHAWRSHHGNSRSLV